MVPNEVMKFELEDSKSDFDESNWLCDQNESILDVFERNSAVAGLDLREMANNNEHMKAIK